MLLAILAILFALVVCIAFLVFVSAIIGAVIALPIFLGVILLGWGLTYLHVWVVTTIVTFIWIVLNAKIETEG